jgi:hypothetical protein
MSTLKTINVIHPSSAVNNIVNDASGNVAVGNNLTVAGTATVGGVAAVAVAPSTAGNVLTSNGTAWTSAAPSSSVPSPSAIGQIPFSTNGSTWTATQKITQGTSVSLSTNTSVDFTSIPSWVKRISMMFYTVSINGTSRPTVRLGTSGGIVSTGYAGTQYGVAGTGGAFANLSGGFDLIDSGSAVSGCNFCGILTIDKLGTGDDWVANWTGGLVNAAVMQSMGGAVPLSGPLTTVRLTTQGGTVQFTGGTVNILYE